MKTPEQKEELAARLVEAATALLFAAPRHEMQITNLNKALFYLDLVALRDHGDTVTHQTYIALKQGPVVANFEKRLVAELEARQLARQTQRGASKPLVLTGQPVEPYHTAMDTETVARVAAYFAEKTAKEASDYSHENPGWRIAWNDGAGASGPPKPIDLHLAMLQVLDDDPWLDEPADAALLRAFKEGAASAAPL